MIFARIFDLVGECLELFIKGCSSSSLLLLLFEFFFVAETMLSLSVAGFIELHVSCLAIELDVSGFLLSNHDWISKVNMDDDDKFMHAWLEEKVLAVTEQNVNLLTAVIPVSYAVCMNVDFA